MARKGAIKQRNIPEDPVYNSKVITKFINRVMRDGKKSTARQLVYKALDIIREQTNDDPMKLFDVAMQNVGPKMEVKARRIGGASYQVPQEVRGDRRVALATRWIIASATKLPNKEYRSFAAKLAAEFMNAAKGEGESIRKRDLVHKMAEANRAFAHFRF